MKFKKYKYAFLIVLLIQGILVKGKSLNNNNPPMSKQESQEFTLVFQEQLKVVQWISSDEKGLLDRALLLEKVLEEVKKGFLCSQVENSISIKIKENRVPNEVIKGLCSLLDYQKKYPHRKIIDGDI